MTDKPKSPPAFYIADIRRSFRGNPYITFWRPKNAGYCYPLSWAGRYSLETLRGAPSYYEKLRDGCTRALSRFAVPCEVAEAIAEDPASGMIDGDAGLVVRNTADARAFLRRKRLRLADAMEQEANRDQ